MNGVRARPTWLLILAASVPMFMAALDNLVVTSALPVLRREFDASIEELQWFVNAYTLAFAGLILVAVALGDRFGRRRMFALGLALFTVASALCAVSVEPWQLIAARAVQGAAAAALMPLSLTLLSTSVPQRLRPMAIGVWGGVTGLGVALGPLVGGAVVEGLSWHAIFWLNVPIGVLSLPLVLAVLPESFGRRVRIDLVGVGLASAGLLALVYGIVRAESVGWGSAQIVATLTSGVVLLALFVAWERRTRDPLLSLGLFRDRGFSAANVVGVLFSFGVFGAIFILIQFLQVVQGYSPLEAGVLTMPWTMAPMVVAPLAGLAVPRLGTRLPIVTGLVFVSVALAWIALVMTETVGYGRLVGAFVLAGVGMGLVIAPSATAVLATIRDDDNAKASGTNSALREIGVALGIAVLTAVFTGAGGQLTPTGYVDAAVVAVLVGAGVVGLGALAALALPHGRTGRSVESAAEAPMSSRPLAGTPR
ncbi:DHA2 family efflux MFS transporter permease subunit [Jiangella sp. DSM 45060]|uniref:DHA2 family efflux MFS transporter permease subunit n=1 Tax=Jiangella sp. DSM 45060 TaxID=1798224 RepID=UPI00087A584F|nr:DHA2 family efflux MFS transporter permease subunit [Jiangella sp. DSM 45060]SDT62262.1 drug resistance transporter, EmrB/QacA subfamily [Jiangella sp. DSM 45060]